MLSPDRCAELATVVTPTAAEIVEAKRAILALLSDGRSRTTQDLLRELGEQVGIPPRLHDERYDVPPDPAEPLDRGAVVIRRSRMESANRFALAQLAAEGLLVAGDGSPNDYVQVGTLSIMNTSGSER